MIFRTYRVRTSELVRYANHARKVPVTCNDIGTANGTPSVSVFEKLPYLFRSVLHSGNCCRNSSTSFKTTGWLAIRKRARLRSFFSISTSLMTKTKNMVYLKMTYVTCLVFDSKYSQQELLALKTLNFKCLIQRNKIQINPSFQGVLKLIKSLHLSNPKLIQTYPLD